MKYLPVDQGESSNYDVFTRDKVKVTYDRKCSHPFPLTTFDLMDRRSKGMDKFYGTCCRDCGLIFDYRPLK